MEVRRTEATGSPPARCPPGPPPCGGWPDRPARPVPRDGADRGPGGRAARRRRAARGDRRVIPTASASGAAYHRGDTASDERSSRWPRGRTSGKSVLRWSRHSSIGRPRVPEPLAERPVLSAQRGQQDRRRVQGKVEVRPHRRALRPRACRCGRGRAPARPAPGCWGIRWVGRRRSESWRRWRSTQGAAALSTRQRSQGSSSKSRLTWKAAVCRIILAPDGPMPARYSAILAYRLLDRSSGACSAELYGSMPTASSSMPSLAAAARSGGMVARSSASSALGERHGRGAVLELPARLERDGARRPAARSRACPWRCSVSRPSLPSAVAPEKRQGARSAVRLQRASASRSAHSTGISSTSAPTRRGVSEALGGAAKTCVGQVGLQRRSNGTSHAGAPTTRAKSASGSLRQVSISSPAASNSSATLSRSCLQLISVRIDSPARETDRPDTRNLDPLLPTGDQVHLDPVRHRLVEGQVIERHRIEVRAQLLVEHQQHVAVECRGHARTRRCTPPRSWRRPSAGPHP